MNAFFRRYVVWPYFAATALLLAGCGSDEFEPIGNIDPDVPFSVNDLAISVVGDTLHLSWTATGDDGPNGIASRYDMRRHDQPITEANWPEATPLADIPRPQVAGTHETIELKIEPDEPAFFLALKVVDDSNNVSGLSNVVFLDRRPPDVIGDLAVLNTTYGSVVLKWAGAADDGPSGVAARYEIRATTGTIDEAGWADLRPALDVRASVGAGAQEVVGLGGLDPQTTYRVAVRARDGTGNLSPISNIAVTTTRSEPVGWWDGFAGQGLTDAVAALHATPDTLYVGGRFAASGTKALSRIGAWDGSAWHSLGRGFSAGQYGTVVMDITSFGGRIFACGDLRIAGVQPVNNLAAWTGGGWENPGGGPTDFPPVVMAVWRDELYVGGFFQGTPTSAFNFLSRFDGTTFHGMGWGTAGEGFPTSLLGWNEQLVVGGAYEDRPIPGAQSIVMWDGAGYTSPGGGLDPNEFPSHVNAMVEFQGDLIVGGDFPSAGGMALNGIARWDGVQWHQLSSGMTGGEFPHVSGLAVYEGYLVAAGRFDTAGGVSARNIALWDGYAWQPMGSGLTGDEWSSGGEMQVFQGSLYIGGDFESAGGFESRNIARWDLD